MYGSEICPGQAKGHEREVVESSSRAGVTSSCTASSVLLVSSLDIESLMMHETTLACISVSVTRCAIVVALTVSMMTGTTALGGDHKPDVLFILLDDYRQDAFSFLDHPYVKTPNIDRLRMAGAWLENAFVTTSICCPSRATFLTGCYASRHGVVDNETAEYNDSITPPLTRYLQESGYSTAMIGKWHMGYSGRPRPSFDLWISFDGQGVYHDPELNIMGKIEKREGYTTDLLTNYAIDFIDRQPTDHPYFLMLSHKAVHEPFEPAERHKYAFGHDRELPEPASWTDDFRGKPLWQKRDLLNDARWSYRTRDRENEMVPDVVPPRSWDDARKENRRFVDQLRCIAAVDEGVGRLIEKLVDRGTLDNTLIVFASDNGYFQQEHRRCDKRLAYDESMRIPMIIVYPGVVRKGSSINQMITNADFAPTVLDFAGIAIPPQMQGRSMRPLFEGDDSGWREHTFYEYWTELVHSIPTMIAVRTKQLKLVRYPNTDELQELYDLESDPAELLNVVDAPQYAEQRVAMEKLLEESAEEVGWKRRVFPLNLPRVLGKAGILLDIGVEEGVLMDRSTSKRLTLASDVQTDDSSWGLNGQSPPLGLAYSEDIEPSYWPYEIEVSFQADDDGVLLSQSGEAGGLAIFVEDRRPVVTLRISSWVTITTTIDGPTLAPGQWADVIVRVDYNQLSMSVNGAPVETVALPLPSKKPTKGPLVVGGPSIIPASKDCISKPFSGRVRCLQVRRPEVE